MSHLGADTTVPATTQTANSTTLPAVVVSVPGGLNCYSNPTWYRQGVYTGAGPTCVDGDISPVAALQNIYLFPLKFVPSSVKTSLGIVTYVIPAVLYGLIAYMVWPKK